MKITYIIIEIHRIRNEYQFIIKTKTSKLIKMLKTENSTKDII